VLLTEKNCWWQPKKSTKESFAIAAVVAFEIVSTREEILTMYVPAGTPVAETVIPTPSPATLFIENDVDPLFARADREFE
jgi:hypothetical protein